MLATVPVHIGDVIEFSRRGDEDARSLTTGRVMDVDPTAPHECVIQITPYEPFRQVDLSQTFYKVVYAVGDMTRLKPEMIGWEVEVLAGEKDCKPMTERGVIKQVDCELNCALIAFDDGRKDWRDLTMNAFKVLGHLLPSKNNSPQKTQLQNSQLTVGYMPRLQVDSARVVHAIKAPLPVMEATEFDWYTEGGHVELCDSDGTFYEGALLCSQRNQALQLYNEKRQFFEIQITRQSFKVVIHGLVALKSVPLGQAVEVYSPMHGEFKSGVVMKAAEVGKLTPVRFDEVGLEWLDLTSQTFKLVYLTRSESEPQSPLPSSAKAPESVKSEQESVAGTRQMVQILPSAPEEELVESPTKSTSYHHKRAHDPSKPSRHHPHSALPELTVGQSLELLDPATKQFTKYRVTCVHHPVNPHVYDLEVAWGSSSGSSLVLSVSNGVAKQTTVNLAAVKARLLLTTDLWAVYSPLLRGYRVDIYDKVDRSVLNAKIIDCDDSVDGGRIYVKLKDGSKRWLDVKGTKIKLKFSGESHSPTHEPSSVERGAQVFPSKEEPVNESMWQRVDHAIPPTEELSYVQEAAKSLTKQQTEKVGRASVGSINLMARQASSPGIILRGLPSGETAPSTIPSLDFSNLRSKHEDSSINPPPTTESKSVEVSPDSQRSTGSNTEALSDLLPQMDDVWAEEPTGHPGQPMRYVHGGTGEVQYELPQWLKKWDEATGGAFILNTVTGVRFQLPGSSSTPQTSGRAAVVTLPVGPLEAARVASRMNSSVDLCAEAFGP